jgi:predicted Rossmann fold nucleotide-binding protein DprA/Smf involved in DNA uptake
MKTLSDQLQSVSKFLVNLSNQVEKIARQMEKRQEPEQTKQKEKPAASKKIKASKNTAKQPTRQEKIYDIIKKSKKGVTTAQLKEKTGMESKQISNALYKLSKRGLITSASRGVYVKK